jgi:nucleoside-diphosphate-sugar epimerase
MQQSRPILVTGAAGLIGSQLMQQLIARGEQVVAMDKRFPIPHPSHGDIKNIKYLEQAINNCRGVVHLAAVSRVVWGERDPEACWDINVNATANILEIISKATPQPWLIYASSREVYGQQDNLPITENAELMPVNVYARSKVAAEKLVNQYRDQGLMTAILRFSSVYGSVHDHPDRVLPAFCRNAILDKPLRVEGLHNVLDFTHLTDTVEGILSAINKLDQSVDDLPPIHLTTGKGTCLMEVVSLIEQVLEKPIMFEEAPSRTYDVHRFYAEPARAKELLHWNPRIELLQGLHQMLNQYQYYLRGELEKV